MNTTRNTDPKPDESLLSEFVRGQRAALGELAERYERGLLGLACGLLDGRRELACDAVQETWVRVVRFADRFRGQSSFKTWLYRICINQCRSMLEAQADEPECGEVAEKMEPREAADARVAAADEAESLRRLVAQLDANRRFVVLLCYHSGMTHEQAAEILEVPLGTLKSRLNAALTELRVGMSARLGADSSSHSQFGERRGEVTA